MHHTSSTSCRTRRRGSDPASARPQTKAMCLKKVMSDQVKTQSLHGARGQMFRQPFAVPTALSGRESTLSHLIGVCTACFSPNGLGTFCLAINQPKLPECPLTTELTLFRISFWGDIVRGSSRLRRPLRGLLQDMFRPDKEDGVRQRRDDLLE